MQRNRTALCKLAKWYDDMENLQVPFYDQGMWGIAITPEADYEKVKEFFEAYVLEDEKSGYGQQQIDNALERIYTEGSCMTYGCVAGNAAAALGYEGREDPIRGEGFISWEMVRPKGTTEPYEFVANVAARALGLTWSEQKVMFSSGWSPKEGLSMGSVLRRLAAGAHLLTVTNDTFAMTLWQRFDLDDEEFPADYLAALHVEYGCAVPYAIARRTRARTSV